MQVLRRRRSKAAMNGMTSSVLKPEMMQEMKILIITITIMKRHMKIIPREIMYMNQKIKIYLQDKLMLEKI
jgi:hypothetical protein